MTLHTAKGLEWPVVALDRAWKTGCSHWPAPRSRTNGLEEERRLCYVGITRAKDKLYVTWARARRRGGQLMPGRASRFLAALPPGVIEEKRTSVDVGAGLGSGSGGPAARGGRCGGGRPAGRPSRTTSTRRAVGRRRAER